YTKLGLALRAAAVNPESSRLAGVRVGWMLALGWGIAAVLGAVAGMMIAPVVFLDPNMMQTILLYAFAAAVLGGLDSPAGAIVGMYFIALLGLSILTGYSGQISLGHGAFMAIGAYTTAILTVNGFYGHHVRDLWTIPIAGVVAGIAGLLVGVPALRLSGLYLALITFGIAVSFPQLPKKF